MAANTHACNVGRVVEQATPDAGVGLFAAKHLQASDPEAGDVVFVDKPIFTIQHLANRRFCTNCANCSAFIGGTNTQLVDTIFNEHHFEGVIAQCAQFLPQWSEAAKNFYDKQSDGPSAAINGTGASAGAGAGADQSVSNFVNSYAKFSSDIVRCACGEMYASEACRQEDWEAGGHKFLCCAMCPGEDAPLFKFKLHAIE